MKHDLTRRDFLQGVAAAALAARARAAGSAPAQQASAQRSLVAIYLRGGADFLNMVVPRDDRTYRLVRPGIGIPEATAVPLDSRWALHPALKPLQPLFAAKQLAPIVNAGSPHPTRSHFDAQDFMNFAAPGDRSVRDGWLNRYLAATAEGRRGDFRALGMQGLLPTCLRGRYPVLAVPDNIGDARAGSVLGRFEGLYGTDGTQEPEAGGGGGAMDERRPGDDGLDIAASGKVTIEALRRLSEIVAKAKESDHGYPKSSLGVGMRRIGQVLLAGQGLEVAAIDVNGWDHHASQGGAEGAQARLLADLAQSLAAFRTHLGPAFESTLVVVMTEFGRTVVENGSGGTDHGHGGGMLLLGGRLKGGVVHGEWTGLTAERLYEGRDLPVTTDFRDVFYTLLDEHLGFDAPKGFFPDYKPRRLRLFA